ncbi:WcaF family extracellular polysaccharide biosynthesis acetyltransferase [Flavobacterium quisquiliarum]|jgi:putative colanic acid biosynthesis acetyltransferase WcaF|uniref:WcaF family extracellular polysaccharide biosynthesis acetyltransferase n=1 Tax=Flavobacterium quisquiliarum TaxID=1834436 RepID=A0ABV8WC91_9FLAO|nr:WcaF family extracellular polysaccharide biosynthesis acetyltransferase [Flavobacterium quisquiliarum]MBW1656718.1 colanic acid biosynthesis acetyltransferase WcaF [Flavobacterium quisquiliarum]NWL00343.1 colanic acid biosynthesis acetyltransferase WcaF [Flavobacterium collinsii]
MKKVRLDLFNSKLGLDRGASKAKEMLWYAVKVVFFLSAIPYPSKLKVFLLKAFGAKVGKGLVIKPRVNIHFPWKLVVGDNVWIGEEVFLLNFELLTIGNNVCISQKVFVCGGNHDYKDPTMPYRNGVIVIEDGSWVGASSFVGPNVKIGINTIVSVGSIVTKSLPENGVFSGNPLQLVKERW